jgi:hypothetical protein
MSETPLPQTLSAMQSADAPDETATTGEFRARRRSSTTDLRPVSAFAPGHATSRSEPPASSSAHAQGTLSQADLDFVAALRSAGVAGELSDTELARSAALVAARDTRHALGRAAGADGARESERAPHAVAARRLDLLTAYYRADQDALASQRRQATDRWFLFHAADALTAPQLLARLLDVVPELQGTELERVGGRNGTLVLRAGDDVCALEDEEVEGRESTISVCDLVRAINVLLDRRAVRARLVGLIGDGRREAYLGLPSVTAAITLSSADYLAVSDAEALLDLTGW